LETARGAEGRIQATRRSRPSLGIAAVCRNESKRRPAAKSPLLYAIVWAAVKLTHSGAEPAHATGAREADAFSTAFGTLCTGQWRQKKFLPGRKSGHSSM